MASCEGRGSAPYYRYENDRTARCRVCCRPVPVVHLDKPLGAVLVDDHEAP